MGASMGKVTVDVQPVMVRRVTADLSVKAVGGGDLDDGQFVGYASVFGNVDSYGEVVSKGAFAKTLGEWAERGDTIPLLWGHDMYTLDGDIGYLVSAEEDDTGLKVVGQLELGDPSGAKVHRLLKGRRVKTMSFAFRVRASHEGQTDDGEDVVFLDDLDLIEVSVVRLPANPEAVIGDVKHDVDARLRAVEERLATLGGVAVRDAATEEAEDPEGGKAAEVVGEPTANAEHSIFDDVWRLAGLTP